MKIFATLLVLLVPLLYRAVIIRVDDIDAPGGDISTIPNCTLPQAATLCETSCDGAAIVVIFNLTGVTCSVKNLQNASPLGPSSAGILFLKGTIVAPESAPTLYEGEISIISEEALSGEDIVEYETFLAEEAGRHGNMTLLNIYIESGTLGANGDASEWTQIQVQDGYGQITNAYVDAGAYATVEVYIEMTFSGVLTSKVIDTYQAYKDQFSAEKQTDLERSRVEGGFSFLTTFFGIGAGVSVEKTHTKETYNMQQEGDAKLVGQILGLVSNADLHLNGTVKVSNPTRYTSHTELGFEVMQVHSTTTKYNFVEDRPNINSTTGAATASSDTQVIPL